MPRKLSFHCHHWSDSVASGTAVPSRPLISGIDQQAKERASLAAGLFLGGNIHALFTLTSGMTIEQAAVLLRAPRIEWTRPQTWCDLGCGEGTFTVALASLLAPGSTIHAVDVDQRALEKVPERHGGVEIRTFLADINSHSLRLPNCDGILMANSLHFIQEQGQLLSRLTAVSQRFLVVEYERSRSSVWGPYPVNFQNLCDLFHEAGDYAVNQINLRKSRFGGTMYSALAELNGKGKDSIATH